jgi:hypothetical protein
LGDQINNDEMCGTWASSGEKGQAYIVSVGNVMEGDHLEKLGLNGRLIL